MSRLSSDVLQTVEMYRRVEFTIFTANPVADLFGLWSSARIRSISIASRPIGELEHCINSVWISPRRR